MLKTAQPQRGYSGADPNYALPIDDAEAANLYSQLGEAQGLKRDTMLDALEGWATQKLDQDFTQADTEHERIYTNLNKWWKQTGGEQVDEEVKYRTANRGFIASQFGQTVDDQIDLYPSYRDQWTLANFGKKDLSEAETFNLIKKSYETRQQAKEAHDLITGDVALALFDQINKGKPVDVPALMTKWKEDNAEILDALPEGWEAQTLKAAGQYHAETERMLRDHGPVLQNLYNSIQKATGRFVRDPAQEGAFGDRFANPNESDGMDEVIDQLTALPPDVRDRGYAAILMAAKREGLDEKSFSQMLGEGLGRIINPVRTMATFQQEMAAQERLRLLESEGPVYRDPLTGGLMGEAGGALMAQSGQEIRQGEPLSEEERATALEDARREVVRFDVVRELRDLADNRFDPVKSPSKNTVGKFVQDIALLGPQQMAYTAMAVIPIAGPLLTYTAVTADEYNQLRLQGWSAEQAKPLAAASGVGQTIIEVFGARLIFGQSKIFNKFAANLQARLMNPARFGTASSLGIRAGLVYGAENVTEGFQDVTTPAFQELFNDLGAEYPEVKWDEVWQQWRDSRLEVAAAVIVPVMAGHISTMYVERGLRGEQEWRRKYIYTPLGMSQDEIRNIEDGTTPEEKSQRFSQTLQNMPAERKQQIKDNAAAQAEQAMAAQQDPTKPTLEAQKDESGTTTYIVRDETGKEVYRAQDQAAAEEAYVQETAKSTAARFNAEKIELQKFTEWWLTADPKRASNEQRELRDTSQGNAQQKLEALQQTNNKQGIEELHRRIAQSPYAGTPYDQIQILGEASVEQVGEMVFKAIIALNPKTGNIRAAREEMHHTAVRMAVANGRANEQTMREWLDATERVFAEKGLGITLPRADMTDIVESMAVVQEAFENERISADVEMSLPQAFVDYIKRMIQVLAEVLKRGKAIREALDAGALPAEFEAFLVETTGVADQTAVDRARERTEQEVGAQQNYSIGVSSQQDTDYLAAVERGDMEAAQRMVDDAARRAGYVEAGSHGLALGELVNNQFDPALLGTNTRAASAELGYFFASEKTARNYGLKTLNAERAVDVSDVARGIVQPLLDLIPVGASKEFDFVRQLDDAAFMPQSSDVYDPDSFVESTYDYINVLLDDAEFVADDLANEETVLEAVETARERLEATLGQTQLTSVTDAAVLNVRLKMQNPAIHDQQGKRYRERSFFEIINAAKEAGNDSVIIQNTYDGGPLDDVKVVFDPSQIKSADPVTYDASGNVIPLSQRFDATTANINYSIVRSVDHFKNDTRFDKLVKDGRVFTGVDVNDFIDQHILLHSPDNAFAGTIQLTDGGEIKGKGGVYYPALYADDNYFWASTEAMVMRTANHLNEIGAKNGGRILMGLVSAPVEKLFSSTSMSTGVVKFLNALTNDPRAGLSKADLNAMLVAASKVEVVVQTKTKTTKKTFSTKLKASDSYAKNFAKIDELLAPDGSIFQVRKAFVESLAEQVSKHLNATPASAEYVAGILADAENKHAKNAIKRGKLSKASFLQGLGNMLTEPFLRDFQQHGNGKIYAIVEVQGEVKGIATTEHESYPATIVPVNKKSKVKLHVLKEAVDWQDVVGKETGQYATPQERLNLLPTSGMSSTNLKVLGVKAGSSTAPINYSILARYEGTPSVAVEGGRPYSPIVRDLLKRRAAGEDIPREVIDQAINENFPAQLVEVPRSVAELPDRKTIDDAIDKGQRDKRIDVSTIEAGEKVAIRQDVPAMTRKGVGVVTVKSKAGNSYEAAVRITEPEFVLNEKKSLRIAMGEAKGPHIVINGKWAADQSMPDDLETWTQVGYNPDRHSFYYDRATMQQVTGGSEAYQIGNTVFVKDAQYGDGQISDISYSISTQSEIDRVQAAMGALDRSPLDTLEITEKLRKRFASIMAENMVELAAMRQGGVAEREVLDEEGNPIGPQPTGATTKATGAEIRRTKLLQALGELDGLLSALPPQVAAKVGGYTVLANIGTGDRALSNFFIKRLEMIDKELERYLKDRYTKALDQLFQRAKPRQDAAGKVPQGKLGASVHALFDQLKLATKKTVVEVDGEVTSLEQQVASGELEAEEEAMKGLLADVLPLFANWSTADASRMAQAVQIGFDILRKAYKRQRELTQIKRNQQEERRLVAKESTGITGDIDEAINKQQNIAGKRWQQWKALNVNLFGFDQLISFVFGRDSKITKEIVNAQRKADNVKADELIGVWEEWQGVLAELAGVEDSRSMKATHKGQDIVYRLAEPKTAKIKHTNMQGEEIELEFSQNQLITITMMWMQPKGRAHMMGKLDSDGNPIGDWHYDQDFVNRVEAKMTPEARAIRRFLLRKYAEEWSSINEVFVRLRGINMPQEDFYSPLGVDPVVAIDSGLLADPSTGFALSAPNRTPPALRSRGAAVAKPKFQDAVQVYFAHRKQMAHWKAYAEFNSDMLSVLGHRNTRNAVEAKGGVEALKTLNKWLTYMTQGGNIDAAAGLAMNEYFNGVMGRIASFILFGKVVTIAIQSTQLGAAAAKMPFPSYIKRLAKLLTGQMSWGTSLRSPYIQRRIKEMPPQVQLAMEGLLANKPSYVAEAARRVGWYISGSDGLYTAGTYAMIYDYRLEQAKKAGLSGPEAERVAREEAERDTDEVAQPTRMGARSAFEATMTSPLARSAWAFGSDARKNWAMNSFLWFSNASADRKRQALYFTAAISTAMATVIRTIARDIKDDDDDELFDEKNWDVRRMVLMMATDFVYGFPVLGEMAEETAFRLFGEYRPQGSVLSVGDAPAALSRMPQHIADTLNGEADTDKIVKDVNRMLQGMGLFAPQAASAAALSNAAKDLYEFTKPLWKDDE